MRQNTLFREQIFQNFLGGIHSSLEPSQREGNTPSSQRLWPRDILCSRFPIHFFVADGLWNQQHIAGAPCMTNIKLRISFLAELFFRHDKCFTASLQKRTAYKCQKIYPENPLGDRGMVVDLVGSLRRSPDST